MESDVKSEELWRKAASEGIIGQMADPAERLRMLPLLARDVRLSVLEMIASANLGHIGGDFSITDVLTTLFFGILKLDPKNPGWPQRDRFIMSKGHCAASLYTVLAMRGFFPRRGTCHLYETAVAAERGTPNRRKLPGVETNTGALGHGLPVAVGCALASRLAEIPWRTFVVLGDGELQEGSNWEAAMAAGHQELSSLTAIVDRNHLQQGARTEETNRLEPAGGQMAELRLDGYRCRWPRSRGSLPGVFREGREAALRHRAHGQR